MIELIRHLATQLNLRSTYVLFKANCPLFPELAVWCVTRRLRQPDWALRSLSDLFDAIDGFRLR